jgi:molybdenum cofactor biosynthesis protein B
VKPHEQHRDHSRGSLSFHIVTVSSTRFRMKSEGSQYKDESGDLAARIVQDAGHKIETRKLLPDNKSKIRGAVRDFLDSDAGAIVFIGGTGVSHSDVTVETVVPFFEKELTGFGELFRNISYQKIGSAAMLTRATAGTAKGKLVVCLPGSPGAVETALQNFISEFPHIISVARGKLDTGSSV